MTINKVFLSGNLTRDPELKPISTGTNVLEISIAVNENKKTATGWEQVANFFDCSIFGKRAESLAAILKKGMKVVAQGRLRQSRWESNGDKKSKVSVILDEVVTFPKNSDGQSYYGFEDNQSVKPQSEFADEDVPF